MLTPSKATYVAAAVILAGQRVKFVGDGTQLIVPAGVGDADIGTAILHSGQDVYQINDPVGLFLNNHPGSRTCKASGAVTATSTVRKAANGAVSASGTGTDYGIALEDAADGDYVEVIRGADSSSASAQTVLILPGANSTGGPQNLAAAGITANSRIQEVIDLTTPAVLDKTKFTPGAAIIIQAQSAGDLSAKKLQFRLN